MVFFANERKRAKATVLLQRKAPLPLWLLYSILFRFVNGLNGFAQENLRLQGG